MKKISIILLTICILTLCLASCGGNKTNDESNKTDDRVKITELEIQSALEKKGGTLTIEGSSDDVTSFKYVVANVNASKLLDKSYTSKAVNTLLTDPTKITYGELKVCNAFSAASSVVGLFADDGEFDTNAYVEEIINIICDGSTKTYGDWKVSAEEYSNDSGEVGAFIYDYAWKLGTEHFKVG